MRTAHPRVDWDRLDERAAGRLLRVGSYNVHRCVGTDLRRDTARVARVIRDLDCDTVGLQEVDSLHARGDLGPQLEHLAAATRMQAISGWTMARRDGKYGNALLTRRPVKAVRRHDLSVGRAEPRGALHVELDVAGASAHLLVTHLGLVRAERRTQVRQLLELLRGISHEHTVVLLGDINEWLPGGRCLRWLNDDLGSAPAARSFPVWLPLFALDRLWVRPRHALVSFEVYRSELARVASDHYPIRAAVEVGAHAEDP